MPLLYLLAYEPKFTIGLILGFLLGLLAAKMVSIKEGHW